MLPTSASVSASTAGSAATAASTRGDTGATTAATTESATAADTRAATARSGRRAIGSVVHCGAHSGPRRATTATCLYSTFAQGSGALATQTCASSTNSRTACTGRRVGTTVHTATQHVDGAGMVVVSAKAAAATSPIGITIAIIGIVPIIVVVIPGIVPSAIPTGIPGVRTVIPRIVDAQMPAGVIPGIVPVVPAVGAIEPGRMPQQVGPCLLIARPLGFIVRETIVVEEFHLTRQVIVVKRIGIDTQLAIEIYNIGRS